MPLEDWAIPGIGAVSSIVDGAIQRGRTKRDFERSRKLYEEDREYNSPKNQLARIHEAGLPSAAYFGGSASSQAEIFTGDRQQSEVGLKEAGESISKYHSTRLERVAVETAETNLEILKNQKKVSDVETADALSMEKHPMSGYTGSAKGNVEYGAIPDVPRVVASKRRQHMLENAKIAGQELANQLQGIEIEYRNATSEDEKKLLKQKINNIIEDTLGKEYKNKMLKIDSDNYQERQNYENTIRDIKNEFWSQLRDGRLPRWQEFAKILLLMAEGHLQN